jgi:flagellar biosynthesis/type III secretory pathway M-ring protein FliF/YscJ
MSTAIIQHRYHLRSNVKLLKQPKMIVEEQPIKISIWIYLLNLISYLFEICTPKVYKNILKRQSEQDAHDRQQEQEQEDKDKEDKDKEDEDKEDEDKEDEDEDKEDEDKEDEVVEQMELLSHTNICGLVSLIKTYIDGYDTPIKQQNL